VGCHHADLEQELSASQSHRGSGQPLLMRGSLIWDQDGTLGNTQGLGLGAHLFVKVARPGDSEGTFFVFEATCHLLLPV